MTKSHVLTIVVPAYNEEPVIKKTTNVLLNILNQLIEEGAIAKNSSLLYVDDGSEDQTWPMIEDLHRENSMVTGVKFAHNAGHQNALIAGITVARKADYIVTIDADLQDNPESIIEMVSQANGGKDIVFGVRNNRDSDTWFKRHSAGLFYKLMGFLGVEEIPNHADFRLINHRVIEAFLQYPEREMYLRGIFPQLGFNQGEVYYARTERQAGESKYPLSKMLSLAIDGITSFSVKPIKMIRNLGLIVVLVGIVYLGYSLIGKLMGRNLTGWTSIIASIWLIGGFQLIALGIVGEYIGRIFTEVKHRPRYIIETEIL